MIVAVHSNIWQDMTDRRMAHHMDSVHCRRSHQRREHTAMRKIQKYESDKSPKQSQTVYNYQQTKASSRKKNIAEEQAGFRAGKSTTKHVFNLRILCENYLQHHHNLYYAIIYFRITFDRVWHAALWAITWKYSISSNLL